MGKKDGKSDADHPFSRSGKKDRARLRNVHLDMLVIVITPGYISARGLYSNDGCVVDIAVIPVGLQLNTVSQEKFGRPAKPGAPTRKKKHQETTTTAHELREERSR